jgi:hypothetical protein
VGLQQVPKWFCPNMAVNELREINWVGPITLESVDGGIVAIPEPRSHTGYRPVNIRLLSACNREGLVRVSQIQNIQDLMASSFLFQLDLPSSNQVDKCDDSCLCRVPSLAARPAWRR